MRLVRCAVLTIAAMPADAYLRPEQAEEGVTAVEAPRTGEGNRVRSPNRAARKIDRIRVSLRPLVETRRITILTLVFGPPSVKCPQLKRFS